MPRALWTGSLSFGLVNVPVQLFSAVHDVGIHFRQIHEKDGAPIEMRRFCSKEDKEVPFEAVGHGYDLDGKQVVLTDEELALADPRKTRTIDIEAFVDLADVDPIYFDHPYWLGPAGEGEGVRRAYRLLLEVMRDEERAALGRFVMRTKEYLVLIRVREDRLALTTMLFHDEIRPAKAIGPAGRKKPAAEQVDEAVSLIEAMTVDWDPERYEDRYRKRLKQVIDKRRKGGKVTVPEPEKAPGAAPDLMAALEKTLAEMRGGGKRDGGELESLTKEELSERAAKAGVKGRSKMSKEELIEAVRGS